MVDDRTCPTCGEAAPAGANWCEACGSDLAAEPAVACVSCGRTGIGDDGYCSSCGHKQPDPRDHTEISVGPAVAVSDRGLRHHHNEDAVALGALTDGAVLVVCDGVSSTAGSAVASAAAAEAATAHLVAALSSPPDAAPGSAAEAAPADGGTADGAPAATGSRSGIGPDSADGAGPDDATVGRALQEATVVAQEAAEAVADGVSEAERASARQPGPPSSTFVAAVTLERPEAMLLAVAWLGDSRAYWIDEHGASLLTQDHEVNGSLVRWVGADSGRVPPDVVAHTVTTPGRVLLCSDGLWRYADPASELHTLVQRLEAEGATDDLDLARRLTDHAIAGGGHDNISVAIWSRRESMAAGGSPQQQGEEQTT